MLRPHGPAIVGLALAALLPATARARDAETPPRKGFYAEMALRPGVVAVRDGVVPAARTHLTIGGGLSDRFKLGVQLAIGGYLHGAKKPALGFDTIATGYVWRGLYLRAGAGVVSQLPVSADGPETRPGYGGLAGLGYEWTLHKAASLGLGVDLDVRTTADRHVARACFVGLHFAFH